MVSRLLIFLAALLLPAQAFAQSPSGTLEGHWAFRIDEATIFVFRLDRLPDETWQGAWKRPVEISSNGAVFQRMSGMQIVGADSTSETGGVVQLTFAGPPGNTNNDVLRFRLVGENRAELTYVGIPGDPYPLIRVQPDTALGPFEEAYIYDRDRAVTEADYVAPWEPLGLVDAQPQPEEAPPELPALEPLDPIDEPDDLELVEVAPEDILAEPEGEEEEEDDRPRIDEDFLDGL